MYVFYVYILMHVNALHILVVLFETQRREKLSLNKKAANTFYIFFSGFKGAFSNVLFCLIKP